MWLCDSSVGRKVVMSVTGIALILFLTFHACMNVVALFSADGYNMICKFLGSNWYAVAATLVLAALVVIHIVYAFWLTLQNRKARGNNRYTVTSRPDKVEWASQNMLVLGIIVILGIILHLWNFWWNMMAAELMGNPMAGGLEATNGYGYIVRTFSCPWFTVLYVVWLIALWFHLTHGFWSAIQTLGWNGKIWFSRWRVIGNIYVSIVILLFLVVALLFSVCPKCLGGESARMALQPCMKGCAVSSKQGCAECCGEEGPEACAKCCERPGKQGCAECCGLRGQGGRACDGQKAQRGAAEHSQCKANCGCGQADAKPCPQGCCDMPEARQGNPGGPQDQPAPQGHADGMPQPAPQGAPQNGPQPGPQGAPQGDRPAPQAPQGESQN